MTPKIQNQIDRIERMHCEDLLISVVVSAWIILMAVIFI